MEIGTFISEHRGTTVLAAAALMVGIAFGEQHVRGANVCESRVTDPGSWITEPLCTASRYIADNRHLLEPLPSWLPQSPAE